MEKPIIFPNETSLKCPISTYVLRTAVKSLY